MASKDKSTSATETGRRVDAAADAAKDKVEEVSHKAQAQADKEITKDSDMPLSERIKAGADYIKEKAKETVSSGSKEAEKEKAKGNI